MDPIYRSPKLPPAALATAGVIDNARLARAKPAYTTRFVSRLIAENPVGFGLITGTDLVPGAGDVVLARVDKIGQHARIELPGGRRASLFAGDEILVAYGDRYAPDQFEAEVPPDLGAAHLVAAGGVAARVLSAHGLMKPPTEITPIGLVVDAFGRVTLSRCAPHVLGESRRATATCPLVIAVIGTSMNSGKTTAMASVARGLRAAGRRVAAGKVTGTGAGGDTHLFVDSGAKPVLDFTDFGFASTYRLPPDEVRSIFVALLAELGRDGPDAIVIEIADGVLQRETARLISDPVFAASVDHVVFAANDALGAASGCAHMAAAGLPVSAVSGRLTTSPLATAEARRAIQLPVLSVDELASADVTAILPARRLLTSGAIRAAG
jgi:hypothetical protein